MNLNQSLLKSLFFFRHACHFYKQSKINFSNLEQIFSFHNYKHIWTSLSSCFSVVVWLKLLVSGPVKTFANL